MDVIADLLNNSNLDYIDLEYPLLIPVTRIDKTYDWSQIHIETLGDDKYLVNINLFNDEGDYFEEEQILYEASLDQVLDYLTAYEDRILYLQAEFIDGTTFEMGSHEL